MSKKVQRLLFLLSISGLIISIYLYINDANLSSVVCRSNGCETVLGSSYARLFGLPISLLGIFWYGVLSSLTFFVQRSALANGLINWWMAGGLIFTLYLLFLQFFIIKALCLWCAASALIVIAMTSMLFFNRQHS